MSDFGGSAGRRFADVELEELGCASGVDCRCTGATCRLLREIRERRAADLTSDETKTLLAVADSVKYGWPRGPLQRRAEDLVDKLLLASHGAKP
jgi:hypothetical protein